MAKPRIGITRSGSAERIAPSYLSYHERVREEGGEPVDLPAFIETPAVELIAGLDGLILSGGPDVLPVRYGQETAPETTSIDEPRDALELALLKAALARDLPVFAICRGQQVLNVGLGGSLIQHIASGAHEAIKDPDPRAGESRWHDVAVDADTRLAALIGAGRIETNSRHHQAVPADRLGEGLVVTARSDDGIVEAVEAPNRRWLLAVQWHPERDEVAERFRPIFESFIAAASPVPAGAGNG